MAQGRQFLGKFSSVHRTSVRHVDLNQSQIGNAQGLRASIPTDLAFSLISFHSNHRQQQSMIS
jgi:hypothetical protein